MTSQKKQILVAFVALIALVLIVGLVTYELRAPKGMYARSHADLTNVEADSVSPYTDLTGKTVSLLSFQGKPLAVNVWASWSPFSKEELPLLARLHDRYGDSVAIVALNRKEDTTRAHAYLDAIGDPQGLTYLIDPTDHFYTTVAGFAMPETIFFDTTGNIVNHVRGVLTEESFVAHIEAIINK